LDAWVIRPYGYDMSALFLLAVVIVSGIVYHLAQKASGSANPWPMLAVAYGAAFALTIVLTLTRKGDAGWQPNRLECIAGLAIGLAAFGIEAGFFFIYRAGWPLASASVISNLVVTAVLALAGIGIFGERLSLARAAGLALAAGGATLIARG
jgi:drug/metabolite transporter (DMT)-like permease